MRGVCLLAMLMAAATPAARAQAVHGFYLQGSTGIFFQGAQPHDATLAPSMAPENPGPGAAADRANAAISGGPALSESGSLGYGFSQGLRVEVQGIHTAGSATGG